MTFIVTQCNTKLNPIDENYFKFFINNHNKFPSGVMRSKDEYDTLKSISDKYFHLEFDWMNKEICDFRKMSLDECEVIYVANIPEILGITKSGRFILDAEAERQKIKVDKYYEQLLSKRSRCTFRR